MTTIEPSHEGAYDNNALNAHPRAADIPIVHSEATSERESEASVAAQTGPDALELPLKGYSQLKSDRVVVSLITIPFSSIRGLAYVALSATS